MKFDFTNIDLKLINISSILIVLMPFFLVSGSFLSDLFLIIMVIFFFYLKIKKKITGLKKYKNFFIYFFSLNLIFVISSLVSDFPLFSLKSSIFYFRFFLFSFFIFIMLSFIKNLKKFFFYFLLFLFLILIFDCFYQYYFKINIIGLKILNDRASSFFGSELVLGGFLLRFLPLLLSLWIFTWKLNGNKKELSFIFIFIFLVDLAIIFTGERTALILLIVQKILIVIFIPILRKIFLLNLLFIFLILGFLIKTESNLRVISHTKKYTNINILEKNFRPYTTEHQQLFLTAIKMGNDNLLFGVGPNNFRNLCNEIKYKQERKFSCSTHPHNFYLQLFAEGGILSLVLLTILLCFIIKMLLNNYINVKSFNSEKALNEFKMILLGVLCNILPISTSGNFFNNWLNINMYIPIGFLLLSYFKLKKNI